MKANKRIIAVLLAFTMVAGSLVGCGGKESSKQGGTSTTDIEISVWNSGLGTDWLDAMIKGFNEVHPEYNVYYSATASQDASVATYGLEDVDTIDLYLSTKIFDSTYMEPLNELLDSTADGDKKPLKEKFYDSYLTLEKAPDGNIYSLTYGGGVVGIVYNKEMFKDAGIKQVPRTTDELAVVCNSLYKEDIVPFCHFGGSGYWHFLHDNWYGQYEGVDYYLNSFYGNPTKEQFLKKDGRYELLKTYEKLITPEYVLSGSNSSDHTTMQTKFLLGEAAMMVNGSWLANEMKSSGKVDNFETMKLPVLSSITDKLTTVKKESDLRKLIDAVDAVTEGEKTIEEYKSGDVYLVDGKEVSAADWDYIYAARNTVPDNYAGHAAYIPTYSNAKEGAKAFMEFMYSDKGYNIFLETLHIQLPMSLSEGEINTSEWNTFEKNQSHLMNTSAQSFTIYNMSKHKLFTDGGASLIPVTFINKFCSKNVADRISADEAWEELVNTVNDKYEATWLSNIK